jgi:predicted ArsR family transcriptional regulator
MGRRRAGSTRVRERQLRGSRVRRATVRQVDVLAAYVAAGGSVPGAAEMLGIRPSTAKRHLADLRARSGLTTEQLIYRGRAEGWLVVPALEAAEATIAVTHSPAAAATVESVRRSAERTSSSSRSVMALRPLPD